MTPKDHDTDPSTPSSKRLSDPRTAAAAVSLEDTPGETDEPSSGEQLLELDGIPPAPPQPPGRPQRLGLVRSRPTTDPGIAPPPEPLPPLRQPLGIVVPPVARPSSESVDVLLDAMNPAGPGEVPTTSQSDGQATAMYHSEHSVRAARRSLGDEPKVVIERPLLAQTARIQRSPLALPEGDARAWADTTSVRMKPLAGRVAIAVLAGVVVVMVIFGALRRMSVERAAEPTVAPTATGVAKTAFSPAASASETTALAPMPPETPMATATAIADSHASLAPAPVASSTTRKAPAAWKPKQKPKPSVPGAKPAADDLGEFKSSL
jgi:hypothetical protein